MDHVMRLPAPSGAVLSVRPASFRREDSLADDISVTGMVTQWFRYPGFHGIICAGNGFGHRLLSFLNQRQIRV